MLIQLSYNKEKDSYVCMKVSKRFQKASCMLLEHEGTDNPNVLLSVHYTWGELQEDVEDENFAEIGSEKRGLQECFKFAKANNEATISLEDFFIVFNNEDRAPAVRLRSRAATPALLRSGTAAAPTRWQRRPGAASSVLPAARGGCPQLRRPCPSRRRRSRGPPGSAQIPMADRAGKSAVLGRRGH